MTLQVNSLSEDIVRSFHENLMVFQHHYSSSVVPSRIRCQYDQNSIVRDFVEAFPKITYAMRIDLGTGPHLSNLDIMKL